MKKWYLCTLAAIAVGWGGLTNTHSAEGTYPSAYVDTSDGPAKTIAAYNLFKDIKRQIPNEGVVKYEINTPHFADYAELHRYLWLPDDTQIQYRENHTLEYPLGATVILTVGYLNDINDPAKGEKLVETRLIVKGEDEWDTYHYIWNDEMTDARLALAGGTVPVSWTHYNGVERSMDVHVPNKNQCAMCHEVNDKFTPLGPLHARHLNKDINVDSVKKNQLTHWTQMGWLKGTPEDIDTAPRTPVWNDPATGTLNERARAYLDLNCSSCHQPGGSAWTSGLDLRYEQDDPRKFGVYKQPIAAGRGVANARFGILPGDPDESILYIRLKTTDPGMRMPVVGRGLVHDEGLELIREWIEEMEPPEDLLANVNEINELKAIREEWLNSLSDTPAN